MKNYQIIISLILISFQVFAKEEKKLTPWQKQSEAQHVQSVASLREFFRLHEKEKVSLKDGDVCFSYGWKSVVKNKKCLTPDKKTPNYTDYLDCGVDKVLCKPVLFGDQVCVKESSLHNQVCENESVKTQVDLDITIQLNDADEMDQILSDVYSYCEKLKTPSCFKLKDKWIHSLDINPEKENLDGINPAEVSKKVQLKQSEFEKIYYEFERKCLDIKKGEEQYCKNLAKEFQTRKRELESLLTIAKNINESDCVNCSLDKKIKKNDFTEVLKRTCSEEDRKNRFNDCDSDLGCILSSTFMTPVPLVKKIFGVKESSDSCLSNQNSCLTNIVSSLVKSLSTLVKGVWDLIKMGSDWAGEKVQDFWKKVTLAEEASTDAHLLARSLDQKTKDEIKDNPDGWLSNVIKNIWTGLKIWVRNDVFCEKWEGIPRASKCLEPSRGFDCLGCAEIVRGTCSIGGVVLGELMPAMITGGIINVAGRAKLGSEAVAKFMSNHPAGEKIQKLSEVKGIRQILNGTQKSTALIVNTGKSGIKLIAENYTKLSQTSGFQKINKAAGVAAKYTGLKFLADSNVYFFEMGYNGVDKIARKPLASITNKTDLVIESGKAKATDDMLKDDIALAEIDGPLRDKLIEEVQNATTKGRELRKLKQELEQLYLREENPEVVAKISKLETEASYLEREIHKLNDEFLEQLSSVYEKTNIPHQLLRAEDGSLVMFIKPDPINGSNKAHRLISELQKRFGIDSITISLSENSYLGSRGFFMSHNNRLDIGYAQGLKLVDGSVSIVTKHEYRHGMFHAMRNKGKSSEYHMSFHAADPSLGGKKIHDGQAYASYMSAEELYNLANDLNSLNRLFNGPKIKDPKALANLLNQADENSRLLKDVATGVREMTTKGNEWVVQAMKNPDKLDYMKIKVSKNGNAHVIFADDNNRVIDVALVTDAEIETLKNLSKLRSARSDLKNKLVTEALQKRNIDIDELFKRYPSNLTDNEKKMFKDIMNEIYEDPMMKKASVDMQQGAIPALKLLHEKFVNLNYSAGMVLDDLKSMEIKFNKIAEAKAVNADDVEDLRRRMNLISRRVKLHTSHDFKHAILEKP